MDGRQIDRDWYEQSEGGACLDLTTQNDYDTEQVDPYKEEKRRKRVSERHLQNVRDTDRWEQQIFVQSGLKVDRPAYDPSEDKDHNTAVVQLVVHERHPPFIQTLMHKIEQSGGPKPAQLGNLTFDPVQPVRDSTSDMARLARQGSHLVAEMRARKEQQKIMRSLTNDKSDPSFKRSHLASRREASSTADAENALDSYQKVLKASTALEDKNIAEQRRSLPIFAVRSQLLRVIAENQVIIVVGETGSGKTTQLTQYLLEAGYSINMKLMVGCSQPRRVAAVSVAKRVSEELGCELGETVGYAIRFEDCTSPKTRIKYMTDGVLLRECLRDPEIDTYAAIIIDEAHERSLQTDILLGILREIVQKRRRLDLKIIITSATMDAKKFSSFFGDAPIFHIPGRTYPVITHYASSPPDDYVEACVKQVLSLHVSSPPGDILVFMTGQEDIAATCEALEERLQTQIPEASETLHVLPIYSQLPADLQAKIFAPTQTGHRKCIVATNIAETSLTVDGIAYVVDCGFCKIKVYNPRIGMDALQLAPISQAAAQQRAGRAGRTGPGHCYRMYTEQAFASEFFQNNIPEIARTNLANAVLLLKSLNVVDVLSFAFMDAPPSDALVAALFQLWALGALDDDRGRLTRLGHKLVEFPLDPPLAKMLLVAHALGCVKETLSIVSMLSVPTVFHRPKEQLELSDARREKFAVPESDHLSLLQVYNQWSATPENQRESWCQYHFIQSKSVQRAHHIRTQLVDILTSSMRISIESSCGRNLDLIRRVIASAHVAKAARLKGFGQYVNLRTGLPCILHPTSSLCGLGSCPEYVVYNELLLTSHEYLQGVTAVQPEWLAEAGPAFYSLRISEPGRSLKRILNFAASDTPLRNAGFKEESIDDSSTTSTRHMPNENKDKVVKDATIIKKSRPITRKTLDEW